MKKFFIGRFYILAVLITFLLIFASCQGNKEIGSEGGKGGKVSEVKEEKKESPAVESINDYFPHQIGDEYSYWLMVKNKEQATGGEITLKFTGKEKVGEKECTVSEVVVDGRTVGKNFYEIKDDMILLVRQSRPEGEVLTLEPPSVVFKYPFKKDDTWVNKNKQDNSETNCKVVGEEEIELPLGKVKAWKVTSEVVFSETEKIGNESWYVKGIGKVQERNFAQNGMDSQESLITLKYYKIDGVDSNELMEKKITSLKNAHEQVLEYFPLKPGSKWVYRDVTTGPRGKDVEQDNLYEITGVEEYHGKECIILNRLMHKMPMFASKDLYVVEGDKIFTYGARDIREGTKEPSLMLKFPFKAGEKWETNENSVRRIHTMVGEEEVKVPAGTFKAWKMENKYVIDKGVKQTSNVTVWYARGVGVVKVNSSAKSKDTSIKNSMELLEYSIPGEKNRKD